MKWNDIFCHSFKALRKQVEPETRKQVEFMLPSRPMIKACRADDFDFFQPFIAAGNLTTEQMQRACERYCLGKTKSGQPIFWMIDDLLQPLDAHIGDNWISNLLKQRESILTYWKVQHCLFGLHLVNRWGQTVNQWGLTPMLEISDFAEGSDTSDSPISIVESEISAVILSELLPESIWLAYATTAHLVPDLFAPLEGRQVTIYPRTDPTMSTYLFFKDLATLTRQQYDLDLEIDTTLEDRATEDQKERCIDILDYISES